MEMERRLQVLEARLRRTRLALLGLFVCLLLISTVAASSPYVDLVCRSLTIKNSDGKTVTELNDNGDVKIGGKLTVQGRELKSEIDKIKMVVSRIDCGELHLHSNVAGGGIPNWKVTGGKPHIQRIKFGKPFSAPPTIFLSVPCFNLMSGPGPGRDTELQTVVTKVTEDGFEFKAGVWGDGAEIREIRVQWMAIGSGAAGNP